MLIQVIEYLDCLEVLGGKHWRNNVSIHAFLSAGDLHIIDLVILGHIKNDLALAKSLYGSITKLESRYRRRIARLENRLAEIVLFCTLTSTLGHRNHTSIACFRNATVGHSLLRAGGSYTSRIHLLAARRAMTYPELLWYAPPIHLALAFNDAVNGKGRTARLELIRAQEVANDAMLVHKLLDKWIHISIPLRMKSDKAKRKPVIEAARTLLDDTAQRHLSGVVAMAAARLATTIAQLEGDITLGLQWLNHSRSALRKEHRFSKTAEREYYAQRAFIYNTAHDYQRGLIAAKIVVESCDPNSSDWFNAINVVLHLHLKRGEYVKAREIAKLVITQKALKKQSTDLIARLKLRILYAQVLNGETNIHSRNINSHIRYPLDVIVISVLVNIGQRRLPQAIRTLHTLRNHIDRDGVLRKDRANWLLSRLVSIYANNNMSIAACKDIALFNRYHEELAQHKFLKADHSVIAPLLIWRAIIRERYK